MDRSELNQNRIIRLLKEGFKDKPSLSGLRRRNLDKIVANSIELASEKQRNKQLDRTVNILVSERPKKGLIGFLNSLAKWQIAMLSIFALVFVTSGIAFANSSLPDEIKVALSTEAGKIEIRSNIQDANVYLKNKNEKDFKLVGKTNYTLNKAEAGEYEFYIEMEGYANTDIIHFSLNKNGFYTKYVILEKKVDESSINNLDYINTEFGIRLKYPENTTPSFEKFSDDSFKLTIKSTEAIFVLQSQTTQPTLLPNFEPTVLSVSGKIVQGRKYTYSDSSQSFTKESYKYGIFTDGLFEINGINYFLYTESLNQENKLFETVVKDLSLTKTKLTNREYKKYKFTNPRLGISFDYYEDFIYSTEIDSANEVRIRLENKTNKNLSIIINWKSTEFSSSDPINFSSTNQSPVINATVNSVKVYMLDDSRYEMAYILPNNTVIYSMKINSQIEADRLLRQKELFSQTFISTNPSLGLIAYPYPGLTTSSSSTTSAYTRKD